MKDVQDAAVFSQLLSDAPAPRRESRALLTLTSDPFHVQRLGLSVMPGMPAEAGSPSSGSWEFKEKEAALVAGSLSLTTVKSFWSRN